MIDEFIQVVYEREAEEDRITKLAASMEQLPTSELKKIARYGLSMSLGDEGKSWIDKYKGTPMFDRAVELEQQSLQLEMQLIQQDQTRQQDRQQRELQWQAEDQLRVVQDQLCVQKRMLDLELASQQNMQAASEAAEMLGAVEAPAEAPVETAVPPPDVAGAPAQEAAVPIPPEAMKMAAARMRLAVSRCVAEEQECEKRAQVGRVLQKEAISFGAIGQAAKNVVAKNPKALLGAGLGAAAGGVGAGMSDDDGFSVSRALGGAALGAAGGAAAGKAVQLGGSAARIRAQALKNAKTVASGAGDVGKAQMGWGEAARRAWNADVAQQTKALKPLGVGQQQTQFLRFNTAKGRGSQSLVPAARERQVKATQEALRDHTAPPAAGIAVGNLADEEEIARAFAARGLG